MTLSKQTIKDRRNLEIAKQVSTYSKDPSTKVGAVIVDSLNRIVSTGYNGFPRGIADTPERLNNREEKLRLIIHAEHNAILHSPLRDLTGCTLYTYPFLPCAKCALIIIQSGIKQVVTIIPTAEQQFRWSSSFDETMDLFHEAKVETVIYNPDWLFVERTEEELNTIYNNLRG